MRKFLKAIVGAIFDICGTLTSFVGWALLTLTATAFCLSGIVTLVACAVYGVAGGIGWAWLWVWMTAEEKCLASMKRADRANETRFTQTFGRWISVGIGWGTLTIPFVVWAISAFVCAMIAVVVLGVIFCFGIAVVILTSGIQRMLGTLNTRLTGAPPVSPALSAIIEHARISIAKAAEKNQLKSEEETQ